MEFLRNISLRLRQRKSKVLVVLFCFLLVYILMFTPTAIAAQPITVTFDGHPLIMDVPPIVRDGRTLVPLRAIFNALGANTHWDAATGQISAYRSVQGESRAVVLYINNRTALRGYSLHDILTGGRRELITLDTPPVLIGGRTMVPLRFIAESFDVTVNWHPEIRTVSIITRTSASPVTQLPPVVKPPVSQRQKMTSQEVTAQVMPAVVSIDTHRGQGSGFFVSADGLVLTNAHVVRGSRQIVVTTRTGERFSASIAKIANWHDLALLEVNAPPNFRFPFLRENPAIGNIVQGEEVLAFGSPLGLTGTVTRGIISAWREVDVTFGAWTNNNIHVLQHDAAIAPGNSGGPLVNLYGEWVGVNTLVVTDWAGFGFAVPAERYYELLNLNNYSLRCDWGSYYQEEWGWGETYREALQLLDEAIAIQSAQPRAEKLSQYILALQTIRQEITSYQPLYTEVQNLHRLYLARLDAWIAIWTYSRDVEITRAWWSQSTWDMLSNNHWRARDAYNSAWTALQEQFR